jgi:hypothetical protein
MNLTTMQLLLQYALSLPETEDGIACAGTALESITVKTKKKAFLFVRSTEARLKLAGSLTEAAKLAAQQPEHYAVGAGGWVLIKFEDPADHPLDVLKRWVKESHSLFANDEAPTAKPKTPVHKLKKKSNRQPSAKKK